jgi:hypothetical protein
LSEATEKVVFTLKGGPGYEAPWIVIHGESATDALNTLMDLIDQMGFAAVKGAAAEFQAASGVRLSVSQIVADAFPGSEHVYDEAAPAQRTTGPASVPVGPTVAGYQPMPYQVNPGQPYQQSAPPQGDLNPLCTTCQGPTVFKSGTGQKGPWSGYFCAATQNGPKELRHKPSWN